MVRSVQGQIICCFSWSQKASVLSHALLCLHNTWDTYLSHFHSVHTEGGNKNSMTFPWLLIKFHDLKIESCYRLCNTYSSISFSNIHCITIIMVRNTSLQNKMVDIFYFKKYSFDWKVGISITSAINSQTQQVCMNQKTETKFLCFSTIS